MEDRLMPIGEVASQMNITVRTLQYYDKEGLLKPSCLSEGGRRLYSAKDIIALHQILSFKSIGFSLDEIKTKLFKTETPEQVLAMLQGQKRTLTEQIAELIETSELIEHLIEEVKETDEVDFDKYAQIIFMLRNDLQEFWVMDLMDKTLTSHIEKRFSSQPQLGIKVLETYHEIVATALALQEADVKPDDPQGIAVGKMLWDMIEEFTGGDMSLLPKIMEFNEDKTAWNPEMAEKQNKVDGFIGAAVNAYFAQQDNVFPA